jgi:hypothetical protein
MRFWVEKIPHGVVAAPSAATKSFLEFFLAIKSIVKT